MKRGDQARENVKNIIINAFGENYVNTVDKKIYVEAEDSPGGEKIQFAISLTMPKTAVTREGQSKPVAINNNDWTGPAAPAPISAEISEDDKAKVAELMRQLGL